MVDAGLYPDQVAEAEDALQALASRPAGVVAQVDAAAGRYRDHAGPLLLCSVAVGVPAELLVAAAALLPPVPALVAAVAARVVEAALVSAAGVFVLADAGLGRQPSAARALRQTGARLGSVLLLTVLTVLGVAVATLLLVVPGVRRLVLWLPAMPVLLLEETRAPAALARSARLVSRRAGETFLVLVLVLLAAVVLGSVLAASVLVAVRAPSPGSHTVDLLRALVLRTGLVSLLLPALPVVAFTTFVALRERLEGLDLQLAVRRLEVASDTAATTAALRRAA